MAEVDAKNYIDQIEFENNKAQDEVQLKEMELQHQNDNEVFRT